MKKRIVAALVGSAMALATLTGCIDDDARVASQNLSKAADNFEIERRIVFYNSIQDKYILSVRGRCSLRADAQDRQAEVTCKVGEGQYLKHYLGLSDNVTYFAEQVENADVSVYHYRVIFKPDTIIPAAELNSQLNQ
jgi:hypothetical protein